MKSSYAGQFMSGLHSNFNLNTAENISTNNSNVPGMIAVNPATFLKTALIGSTSTQADHYEIILINFSGILNSVTMNVGIHY